MPPNACAFSLCLPTNPLLLMTYSGHEYQLLHLFLRYSRQSLPCPYRQECRAQGTNSTPSWRCQSPRYDRSTPPAANLYDTPAHLVSQTDSQLHIITEAITPLSWETRRKSISEETAKWGLWSVAVRCPISIPNAQWSDPTLPENCRIHKQRCRLRSRLHSCLLCLY